MSVRLFLERLMRSNTARGDARFGPVEVVGPLGAGTGLTRQSNGGIPSAERPGLVPVAQDAAAPTAASTISLEPVRPAGVVFWSRRSRTAKLVLAGKRAAARTYLGDAVGEPGLAYLLGRARSSMDAQFHGDVRVRAAERVFRHARGERDDADAESDRIVDRLGVHAQSDVSLGSLDPDEQQAWTAAAHARAHIADAERHATMRGVELQWALRDFERTVSEAARTLHTMATAAVVQLDIYLGAFNAERAHRGLGRLDPLPASLTDDLVQEGLSRAGAAAMPAGEFVRVVAGLDPA